MKNLKPVAADFRLSITLSHGGRNHPKGGRDRSPDLGPCSPKYRHGARRRQAVSEIKGTVENGNLTVW